MSSWYIDSMAAVAGAGGGQGKGESEDEDENGENAYDYTDPFLASDSESDVEYSSYLAASARKIKDHSTKRRAYLSGDEADRGSVKRVVISAYHGRGTSKGFVWVDECLNAVKWSALLRDEPIEVPQSQDPASDAEAETFTTATVAPRNSNTNPWFAQFQWELQGQRRTNRSTTKPRSSFTRKSSSRSRNVHDGDGPFQSMH